MKIKIVFLIGMFMGGIINAFLVEILPQSKAEAAVVTQCQQSPEVENMVRLMASMPLKVITTETVQRPTVTGPRHTDQIADLIRGLK